jgi:cysteine desulfuration protein SufE
MSPEELEIVEEFELFDDKMDRYEHLIECGKKLAPLDEKYLRDDYLVKGCQSKVWLHAYEKEGHIFFEADSNTAITKGIISLLIKVLNAKKPKEITNHQLQFIDAIDLKGHLSSQRANGLASMIARMKAYAAAYA